MCTAYMIGLKNERTRIFARIEAISVLTFTRKRRGKGGNRRAKRAERQSGEGKGGGAWSHAFDAAYRLNEIIDNKHLRKVENQRGKRPNEKRQNLDSDSKHFEYTVHKSKIAVLTARSLVSIWERSNDKKFSQGTGLVIVCLTKTPRGPRIQSLVTRVNDAVHTLRFLAGNSSTFFPFSRPQTPHCQCNRSCLRRRLTENIALLTFFTFVFHLQAVPKF